MTIGLVLLSIHKGNRQVGVKQFSLRLLNLILTSHSVRIMKVMKVMILSEEGGKGQKLRPTSKGFKW